MGRDGLGGSDPARIAARVNDESQSQLDAPAQGTAISRLSSSDAPDVAFVPTTAAATDPRYDDDPMLQRLREMPGGIRLFLFYAFLILAILGLSLRYVVDQAISAPISLPGIVAMVLLAYTVFTTTLVLQRKEAARNLAIGLATLTLPAIPLLLFGQAWVQTIFVTTLAILLFRGLLRPEVRAYLSEP